jgi:hypothetical protein
MDKRIIGAFLLAAAFCFSGPAHAAQNIANTSQKGSLLIWPLINVDPENSSDSFIEISNDNISSVHVECEYVNEQKGRVDFDFTLTPKQTLSWEVLNGSGNGFIAVPPFPYGGNFYQLGSDRYGELVCFAVDAGSAHQIAFNHLTGTATVVDFYDGDAEQTSQAFRYNAWAFAARCSGTGCVGGLAADNTVQGTAGRLSLTGGGNGTYDACPLYNIANFMPNGSYLGPSGYSLRTIDNDLAVASCNQDLRQDFNVHITKLQFTVWNEIENSFTGAFQCVDSTDFVGLSYADNESLVNPHNFDYSTLGTPNARFQVQGVKSTQCALIVPNPAKPSTNIIIPSENAGLLGVLTSSTVVSSDSVSSETNELGSTTFGAGLEAGYVLWDPGSSVVPSLKVR